MAQMLEAAPRHAALLSLPADMLCKIASHVVAPDLVVAAGRDVSARTALRKGTDEAERSRFGGIGLTVREAEQVLRTQYCDWLGGIDLDSRESVRQALRRDNIVLSCSAGELGHPDAPDPTPPANNLWNGWFASQFVRTIIAYGADPTLNVSSPGVTPSYCTPLHLLASTVPPDAIGLAKLLLAAGVDMDAEGCPIDLAGTCALSWCISNVNRHITDERCALATFLIEQGCDVAKAVAGYCKGRPSDKRRLLESLERRPRTPAIERLLGLISAALEAAGPERCEAALAAARRRHGEFRLEAW